MDYTKDLEIAEKHQHEHQVRLNRLGKERPKDLDDQFHQLHQEVFEEIDCLVCANCCKTTSPIFLRSDIHRLSKTLKMKSAAFINTYLKMDSDQDYVLKESPCPFLGLDNRCIVYENRPTACREYPHTNRKRMYQLAELTFRNTLICPAVSRIVRRLGNV